MEQSKFKELVDDFVSMFFTEYIATITTSYDFTDPENLQAVVKGEDIRGHKWEIPLCIDEHDEEDIGVDVDDAGTFRANGEGLYCYLWHEAVTRLEKAKEKPVRPCIITLCGSSRFIEHFAIMAWELEKQGAIVFSLHYLPPSYNGSPDHLAETEGVAAQMDRLHLHKIDLSDEIFVMNIGGYIGKSTQNEIEYAKKNGKVIKYYEEKE